jgi:putative transposase
MPKKGHTEEIVAGAGPGGGRQTVADICCKVGISQVTYYLWKRQYTGLGVSELRELRQLREENGWLKRLVADPSLDREGGGSNSWGATTRLWYGKRSNN